MKKRNLSVNAMLNIMRQTCGIIFPLLTYPYVSRVLGADSLGIYSFSDSVVSYFVTLASLGIPTYAVREGARIREDKEKAIQFCAELLTINFIALIFSYLSLGLCIAFIPRLRRNLVVTLLLSLNIFANVAGRDWINTIYEDFLYISIRQIIFHFLSAVAIFIFIKDKNDYVLYTLMMMIGTTGGYLSNIFYTRKYVPIRLTLHGNFKKHIKPILLLFCSTVATIIYIKSDITVIGFFFFFNQVGIYTLSSKVYSIIKSILNAIIMVSIPRLSNYLGSGNQIEYKRLLNTLFSTLLSIVMPAIVGLFCLSKEVILIMGGASYLSGTPALQVLCIALFFAVFGCFFSQSILIVNRRELDFLIITSISALINIVLNIIIIPFTGIIGAAITTALAEIIVVALCAFQSRNFFICEASVNDLISVLVGCFFIAGFCLYVGNLVQNTYIRIPISILGSVIGYFTICIFFKNSFTTRALKRIGDRKK